MKIYNDNNITKYCNAVNLGADVLPSPSTNVIIML